MNGKASIVTTTPPFVARFSKDERRVSKRVMIAPRNSEMVKKTLQAVRISLH
jgi:hypothetical protein